MFKLRKSKEEREIERRIRARKAKARLKNYISNLERFQRKFLELGREAAKLGDSQLVRRQASKYLALEQRINRAKKLLILMEDAETQRDLAKVSASFITFSKDISEELKEAPSVEYIARAQVEFEKAIARAESIEEALATVVDAASESILADESIAEEKVEELARLMESQATGEEEAELDKKIEARLKQVEEMMRKG